MQFSKKLLILSHVFFLFYNIALSQQDDIIRAKVTDRKTNIPLSEAFIFFSQTNKILITDKTGEFSFKLTPELKRLDYTVNYIGYEKIFGRVSELKLNNINIIRLKHTPIKVNKVIVKPKSPKDVILKVFKKIPLNYPDFPMNLYSDFIETVYYNDSVILQYEGLLELYKTPYNIKKKDKIRFISAKINHYVEENELWNYIFFIDGPYETLYADVAKYHNSFIQIPTIDVSFLKEKHFKFYSYELFPTDSSYRITFKPCPDNRRGVFEGEIVIDRKSHSILALEYQYSKSRMNRVNNNPSITERELMKAGISTPEVFFKNKILYKKYGSYYIIDSISNEYSFLFDTGESDKPPVIKVKNKMSINNLKKNDLHEIRYVDIIKKGIKTIDQLPKNDSILKLKR